MSKDLLGIYKKAQRVSREAEEWNNLPKGRKYNSSKFRISKAHCTKPKLCRAGQQVCGGKNYWYTSDEFNAAILEYLIDNWESIYPFVLDMLKENERRALIDCQSFIDEMQIEILAAQRQQDDEIPF